MDDNAENTLSEINEVDAWRVSCTAEDGSIPGPEVEVNKGSV